MSGWVPHDAAWWPVIAEALAKPWPREAILFDLRWWADQEKMGRARRPGRPALVERWGVTDWQVKEAFKSESEWGDPSIPPADRQPAASSPPADRQRPQGRTPTTPSIPPADRQPAASSPPADRPARVVDTRHPSPTPDTSLPAPYPRPSGPGAAQNDPKREWVAGKALEVLDGLEGPKLDEQLTAFQAADATCIDGWKRWLRGKSKVGIDGMPHRVRNERHPDGIRARQIEAGLREAAARWLRLDALNDLDTPTLIGLTSARDGPLVVPSGVDLSGVPPPLVVKRAAYLLDLRRPDAPP